MAEQDGPLGDVTQISDVQKTTVYLPEDRIRRLKERADRRRSTMSALLRGAVDHYLGQSEKESRLELLHQREAAERILREEFALEEGQIAALLGSRAEET